MRERHAVSMECRCPGLHALCLTVVVVLTGCTGLLVDDDVAVLPRIVTTEGRVLVVRESVYFVAESDMLLEPGDRVVTLGDAEATVQYLLLDESGLPAGELCRIALSADAVLDIEDRRDCERGPEITTAAAADIESPLPVVDEAPIEPVADDD